MKLLESVTLTNSESESGLRFTTTGGGAWKIWDRFLSLGPQQIIHLGNVCGTCRFFFRYVANDPLESLELDAMRERLELGLNAVRPEAESFRSIVPNGEYRGHCSIAHAEDRYYSH